MHVIYMSVPAGAFAARHADSHGHRPWKHLDLREHARNACTTTRTTPDHLTRKLGPRWARGSEPWPSRWQGCGMAWVVRLEGPGASTAGGSRVTRWLCQSAPAGQAAPAG